FFFVTPLPLLSTLFPYTTLFRSPSARDQPHGALCPQSRRTPRRARRARQWAPPYPSRRAIHGNCGCSDGSRRDFRIAPVPEWTRDRKSTRLNSSHLGISYAVFCL